MKTMKYWIAILSLMLLVGVQQLPAQCPMCKAAVTTGSNYGAKESKLVAGLNAGILYLFLLPYGSLMLLGVVVVVNHKRNQRHNRLALSETRVEDIIGDHVPGKS